MLVRPSGNTTRSCPVAGSALFMNIHVMIVISANLPAADLFGKECNIKDKGTGIAL